MSRDSTFQSLDTTRPVIVLDEAQRGDLGLVRSLGMAGIPVHVASWNPRSPTRKSRFAAAVHPFPHPDDSDADRLACLRSIASSIQGRPIVMMAGDAPLRLTSEHRDELRSCLDLDLPDREVVETCFNKDRFADAAAELGLPVPRTVAPQSLEEVRYVARTLTYPVFVKPFTKRDWAGVPAGQGKVVEASKGQRVDSGERLVDLFERLAEFGGTRAVIQEFISSPDSEHFSVHAYVDPTGTFHGGFSTRKLRVCPPHGGVGCFVLSERVPELIELGRDILRRLRYTGFALLQFKRSSVTGEFLLIEVNCRFSTSGELTTRCGANFPVASYAAMTGQPVPPVAQREGPCWLDFERDFSAFREYRRDGEWTWRGYLRSLLAARYGAFWALDDSSPGFSQLLRVIRVRVGAGSDSGHPKPAMESAPPATASP